MRTRVVQCVCPVPALCDFGHFVGADLVTVVRSSVARLGFDVRKRRHIIAANSIVSNVAVASRTYPRASLLQLHARNARLTARNVRRDLCQPADRWTLRCYGRSSRASRHGGRGRTAAGRRRLDGGAGARSCSRVPSGISCSARSDVDRQCSADSGQWLDRRVLRAARSSDPVQPVRHQVLPNWLAIFVWVCLDHFVFCIFVRESLIFEVLNVD